MSNEEQPNAYDVVLADLLAKRSQLDAAIAAIQSIKGIAGTQTSTGATSGSSTAQIRSDEFFGMTVLDGAKKFLAMMKRPQSSQAITDALQQGGYLFSAGNPVATVASVLNRDDGKGGEVVRTGKAMFGLAAWYPGRQRRKRGQENNDTNEDDETGSAEADLNASAEATEQKGNDEIL